tara:strand:- start:821 stop:1390 length:570 start_codon:yes stop_codon:yes gene_type:complete
MVSCASYPKKHGYQTGPVERVIHNPYFSDTAKDYIYKAKIAAFDKVFGGILIIKKLGDADHRIVFTTEMGNTIFDFSMMGTEIKVNRILEEMDRKLLINVLKKDFTALIKETSIAEKNFISEGERIADTHIANMRHYYHFNKGQLHKIVRTNNGKEKVVFLFTGISNNIAAQIEILHRNFQLKIVLHAI